jgi:hypothetical protein
MINKQAFEDNDTQMENDGIKFERAFIYVSGLK